MRTEIVLGPPGTGKTTKMLSIVEGELTDGTPPDRIGYITFTKRGAGEAVERACSKFKLEKTDLRWFRTIHSLCFAALGMNGGDVLEGKKLAEFGDWLGVEVSEKVSFDEGSTFGFTKADRALFMENLARVRCVPLRQLYDQSDDGLSWQFVEWMERGLLEYKKARGLLDYTDMLVQFVEQEWTPRLDVLVVDEAQDLSQLQWRVVWKLARGCRRVVVAGDDDQAIYLWAGADIDTFVDMEGDVSVLPQSWRVPRKIQAVANRVIGRVRHRRPKEWRARDDEGIGVRVQNIYQVDTSQKDVLVLGRNAYALRPFMSMLARDGIVYEWRGYSSVRQSLLDAIVNWERLRKGEPVTVDEAKKIYEYMSSGKCVKRGYKTLPGFQQDEMIQLSDLQLKGGLLVSGIWHEAMDRIDPVERAYILRARQKGESLQKKPRVRVSTIHGAKGSQAEHVVLLRDMASRTHQEMLRSPEDEARVWYVGLTRVINKLTLVAPSGSNYYDV